MIMRRIRSFARRDSRMTALQRQAFEKYWPVWGLVCSEGMLHFNTVFGRIAPCFLEIGFGSGQSLAMLASQHPGYNFIGIETFKPGIGALLHQIEVMHLTNLRVCYYDAVEVLEKCIPDHSLQGMQIFFPDPWPKSRHHKRRLIQPDFVQLATNKLQFDGFFHLATDWEHYARQMMKVLSVETTLYNTAGLAQFAPRSSHRPVVTKFEGRGEKEGRPVWDLQFIKR